MNPGNSLDLEMEKIKLEQRKLKLEEDRLQLEKERFRKEHEMRKWTIIAVLVPLLVTILTVGFGIWSQAEQSKRDFALRASEIVISADTPGETLNRMRALQTLFPEQLPADFQETIEKFDPSQYSGGPSYENKKNFLRLAFESGDQQQEVIEMYKKLFPDSEIIEAVEE